MKRNLKKNGRRYYTGVQMENAWDRVGRAITEEVVRNLMRGIPGKVRKLVRGESI